MLYHISTLETFADNGGILKQDDSQIITKDTLKNVTMSFKNN